MLNKAEARQVLLSAADHQFCEALKVVLKAYRPQGWLTIQQAAELAGISVRSLQRTLADGGINFSELTKQAHRELAIDLLENTELSVTEIAHALGYSALSNFSRAFKCWTGKSPSGFRKKIG